MFPKLLWNFDGFQAQPAHFASLEFVPLTSDEHERLFAAVDLHGIETAPAFVAPARKLAAFQHTRCAVLKVGENGDPIIEIVRLAAANGMPLLQVCDESLHRADEQMREINPVTEHVAKFAGTR